MSRGLLLGLLILSSPAWSAQQWDFTLHKHRSGIPGPTLLVIGGIQGDEPGGFNAASLLTTEYRVTRGEVWVVPNLNFESIIKRSRGVHGDMNRKFKDIRQTDPEYELVQKIKRIILDPQVDLILNLHDGSGFYRPQYVNRQYGPQRWGQSLIIDQEAIQHTRFGQLDDIARQVTDFSNRKIGNSAHQFHVKNTRTRQGNSEMEKTLTYFAIQNDKPAFGIEASKAFRTHYRAYYHLLMIESFMQYLGIEFQREFALTINDVQNRIDNNIKLSLYEKKMFFDLKDVRKRLNYVPMPRNRPLHYEASNPLIAVLDNKNSLNIRYGNRSVTKLIPEYLEFDNSLEAITLTVDGQQTRVNLGEMVNVERWFRIEPVEDYRINVIGFTRSGIRSEHGVDIHRKNIQSRFSVDRQGQLFRIEIYNRRQFCGMVLVNFAPGSVAVAPSPGNKLF